MKEIKQFYGYSGSKICLLEDEGSLFVRKEGSISRNIERYDALKDLKLSFPNIIKKTNEYYDMEYVKHIDINTYLKFFDGEMLSDFILSTISILSCEQNSKDYTVVYFNMLESISWDLFSFKKEDIMDRLPAYLPCSKYHGDLTLDNILFDTEKENFVLIDPITSVYDSFVFDLAKLNQDLLCGWFARDEVNNHAEKTNKIFEKIKSKHAFIENRYLTILMLFRILPYCQNTKDKNFLIEKIEKLWM